VTRSRSEELRRWYSKGEADLLTICAREDVPEAVKAELRWWFGEGYRGLNKLIKLMEQEEDAQTAQGSQNPQG